MEPFHWSKIPQKNPKKNVTSYGKEILIKKNGTLTNEFITYIPNMSVIKREREREREKDRYR